tara:strand:- start:261 stop:416 length:156 start_codon:yes stop_codon:yes gene_type:complete
MWDILAKLFQKGLINIGKVAIWQPKLPRKIGVSAILMVIYPVNDFGIAAVN